MLYEHFWVKNRPIWIAASTHEGEEQIILQAHRQLLEKYPNLLLLLVPRHPERFNMVADLLKKEKFQFICRSTNELPNENTQVILGDSMGETDVDVWCFRYCFCGWKPCETWWTQSA